MKFTAPRDTVFEKQVIEEEANDVQQKGNVVLFWGGWASQWYPSQFTIDGVTYSCAEQWMMAEKARTFNDDASLKKILGFKYPKAMKEQGRKVKNFNPAVWDAKSFDVVVRGNTAKFSQNEELKKLLLATGKAKIAEASPWDDLWGIGIGVDHKDAWVPKKWPGQNLLGKALMKVRDNLK